MDPLTTDAPPAPATEAGDRERLLVALARHDTLLEAVAAQMPAALLIVEAPGNSSSTGTRAARRCSATR